MNMNRPPEFRFKVRNFLPLGLSPGIPTQVVTETSLGPAEPVELDTFLETPILNN
jgi:hypothetical protein